MENFRIHAVCCTSGGYKNVFAQGVLKALSDNSMQAGAYASCSSSALIAAYAAIGQIRKLDISLWADGYDISQKTGNQSQAMLSSIEKLSPDIKDNLWRPSSSRLLVSVSKVKTQTAMEITQSEQAKRLGQRLLIDALRHRTDWRDQHLEMKLFDTMQHLETQMLTEQNLNEVLYATTRMLHAWDIPAFIDKEAYIDGSYTASCLIFPLIRLGYKKIVYINTEHDKIYLDLFTELQSLPQNEKVHIDIVKPDFNLAELGVDFYTIKGEGLQQVFSYGYQKGIEYINR